MLLRRASSHNSADSSTESGSGARDDRHSGQPLTWAKRRAVASVSTLMAARRSVALVCGLLVLAGIGGWWATRFRCSTGERTTDASPNWRALDAVLAAARRHAVVTKQPRQPVAVFATYGDKHFSRSREAAVLQARQWYPWNAVVGFGPDDVDATFCSRNYDTLRRGRGGGYWLWKREWELISVVSPAGTLRRRRYAASLLLTHPRLLVKFPTTYHPSTLRCVGHGTGTVQLTLSIAR
jgi:hypothetical protein